VSTEIYEAPFNLFAPAFEFGVLLNRGSNHRVTPTSRKIEGEGSITDNAATEPSTWTLSGAVSASAIDPVTFEEQTLANAEQKLKELVAKKAIVLIQSGDVYNEFALITSAAPSQSVEDGDSLKVDITLQEMRVTAAKTTQIPPSRMRRKVKRKAAAPAQGGAGKPKPTKDNRGVALKGLEKAKGSRFR
jgi:hypothetical protein